jgi:hypothetical protein
LNPLKVADKKPLPGKKCVDDQLLQPVKHDLQPVKKRRTDLEKWSDVFYSHSKLTPQLLQLQKDAESQVPGRISFQLPEIGAVAGKALLHALAVLDRLFASWSPLIFKIGWTSNCVSRWCNKKYGYGMSRDQWHHMIVLYYSLEPSGPAMMEAALIEKYNITLFAYVTGFFPIRSIQKLMCVDPIPFSSNPIIKHAAPPRYAWLQKRQSRRGHHDPGPIDLGRAAATGVHDLCCVQIF